MPDLSPHVIDLRQPGARVPETGAHVVLLGTQGGPIPGGRAATASALVGEGSIYLVDAGRGLPIRFAEAGLGFDRVRGMFITHLHSDHYADYFTFFLMNWTNWRSDEQTVEVFGPGRACAAPSPTEIAGLPDSADTVLIAPELPTPGLADTTELLVRANAYDINQRLRSTRRKDGRGLDFTGASGRAMFRTHDLPIPAGATVATPAPHGEGVRVYSDGNVEVLATLVDHPPVFPAYAFRFNTPYGSVVFSGDTSPCTNLVGLASGADLLVNEVMAVDAAIARFRGTPIYTTMAHQFLSAHTPHRSRPAADGLPAVLGVGSVAREAGVRALALNHVFPGDGSVPDEEFLRCARDEFDGPVVVGRDLLCVDVAAMALDGASPDTQLLDTQLVDAEGGR